MNIIRNSQAEKILNDLITYSQMSYHELKLIYGASRYECIKDAMQKLVRAGYVKKISKNGVTSFYATELGYEQHGKRFGYSCDLQRPTLCLKDIDRANRHNYERYVFNLVQFCFCDDADVFLNSSFISIPYFKEKISEESTLELQQIQGSIASFAAYVSKETSRGTEVKIYFCYFLYGKNQIINDTTEKNLFQLVKETIREKLSKDGINPISYEFNAIFVYNSMDLIYDTINYTIQSKSRREYAKTKPTYYHSYGRLINTSMDLNSYRIYLLSNDVNINDIAMQINEIIKAKMDTYKLRVDYNITDIHTVNLCNKSFESYAETYALLAGVNERNYDFTSKDFYMFRPQTAFVKQVMEERMPECKKELLRTKKVYFFKSATDIYCSESFGDYL